MKINKLSIVTALAATAMLAFSPALRAEDKPARPEGRPGGPGGQRGGADFVKQRLERMTEELKLTDAQKPKVEAALKAQGEKMQGTRDLPPEERREKFQAAREEFNKKMKDILDKEQYEKFEKMAQQRPGGQGGRRGGPDGGNRPDGEKKAEDKK